MEVQEGFIVGIFNYCDRWCETCELTSYCRVFADVARIEASLDPGFKAVVEAPALPAETPPPPPNWMRDLIDEMNEAAANPHSAEKSTALQPSVAAAHEPIQARATQYWAAVHIWLGAREGYAMASHADPRAVIARYHTLIPAKIHRALTGLADEEGPDDRPDHDGSAKVARLGIDRSHAAWHDAAARGFAEPGEAGAFTADLVWLRERLEQVFPKADAFVRPGFDEPEAVARLRADESGSR